MPVRVALILPHQDPSIPHVVPEGLSPTEGSAFSRELVRAVREHAPSDVELFTVVVDEQDVYLPAAILLAVEHRAQVLVLPTAAEGTPALEEAVRKAQDVGAHLVAPGIKQDRFFPGDYDGVFAVVPQPGIGPSVLFWVDPSSPEPGMEAFAGCFLAAGRYFDGETDSTVVPFGLVGGRVARAVQDGATTNEAVHQALVSMATASQQGVAADDLPFPELSRLPFAGQVQIAFTWGSRLVQLALGGSEDQPVALAIRERQVAALAGDPSAWFNEVPQLLHEIEPDLGAPLAALYGALGQQHPEALPRLASVLQALVVGELDLQRKQLSPAVQVRPAQVDAARVARWLLSLADHLDCPWDEATEAALRAVEPGADLPQAPAATPEANRLQLHAWLDLAHHVGRSLDPEHAAVHWSVLGAQMAATCATADLLGRYEPEDGEAPDSMAYLPEAHRDELVEASVRIHRRQMDWDVLDPMLDTWARRCLEPLREHPSVAEVLQTWEFGTSNRMAARWPSLESVQEPIAVPWVRAERALRPLRDSIPEAGIAWYAMRNLIDGGLHGDDDTAWIAKVDAAASILAPEVEDTGWSSLLEALGVD